MGNAGVGHPLFPSELRMYIQAHSPFPVYPGKDVLQFEYSLSKVDTSGCSSIHLGH